MSAYSQVVIRESYRSPIRVRRATPSRLTATGDRSAGTRASQATSAATLCDQVACDPRRAERGGTRDELRELALAVTALAGRVLLSTNGFNVTKTMKVIDQWVEPYEREATASGDSAST
jgi:hypothetical protein